MDQIRTALSTFFSYCRDAVFSLRLPPLFTPEYRPVLLREETLRTGLSKELERALNNNEFELYFQCIFSIREQRFTGVEVLCEGVENELQNEAIIKSGCDYIQGFYYSQVYSMEDGIRFLEAHAV